MEVSQGCERVDQLPGSFLEWGRSSIKPIYAELILQVRADVQKTIKLVLGSNSELKQLQ